MSADFYDSNVFIYLLDETEPEKRRTAENLVDAATLTRNGRISYQVVQETLNVVTTKLRQPLTATDAIRFMHRVLVPFLHIMPSPALYERGLEIRGRYGYAFYDSLIIAAALQADCTRLYSEDLQHGQQIEGLTIENPFRDGASA